LTLLERIRAAGGTAEVAGEKLIVRHVPAALLEECKVGRAELLACLDPSPIIDGLDRGTLLVAVRVIRRRLDELVVYGDEDAERADQMGQALEVLVVQDKEEAMKWISVNWQALKDLVVKCLGPSEKVYKGAELAQLAHTVFHGSVRVARRG
jgi:hypothetical protein